MFSTTNFPNASTAQLDDARALYAFLTGPRQLDRRHRRRSIPRPASTSRSARAGARATSKMFSGFAQDSWRMSPTVTLTGGVRYDLQTAVLRVERHDVDA